MLKCISVFGIAVSALLGVAVVFAVSTTSDAAPRFTQAPDIKRPGIVNPVLETDRMRVHLLELTRSVSADPDHFVTSVLFMVEHVGTDEIHSTDIGSLNFSNADGERISMAASECPKSGTDNFAFDRFQAPWHVPIPEPVDKTRTKIVRHWMCDEIPMDAHTIEVSFGRNGDLEEFRFKIRL